MQTPPALRVLERYLVEYRRTWISQIYSTAFTPLGYLLALGFGLGQAIDGGGRAAALGGVSYAAFLAPGLLAATAMQSGTGEATWPVMAGFKWQKFFVSAANTELDPKDLFNGMLLWAACKLTITSATFVAIMAIFGLVPSPLAIASVPAAALCGLAFAAPIAGWTATLHDEGQQVSLLFRVGIMPLFLFSGAFFPIGQLPAVVRWLAYLTPTWHAVEACRMLVLGRPQALMLAVHLLFLLACVVVGSALGHRTFSRRVRG